MGCFTESETQSLNPPGKHSGTILLKVGWVKEEKKRATAQRELKRAKTNTIINTNIDIIHI